MLLQAIRQTMATNKQSKIKDIVDEGFVQSSKVKIHSQSTAGKKTANEERMLYALLTDGIHGIHGFIVRSGISLHLSLPATGNM